jgi:MOSC domain-containing protein YiiM
VVVDSGRLIGIATRSASRAPMVAHTVRAVRSDAGLEGDFRGRPGPRQVTVLAREGWEAGCAEAGQGLEWTARRANLLIEGIALAGTAGERLRIGELVLLVTGECDPCRNMDRALPGLQAALRSDWRGGVCCRVERGAEIAVGDPVSFELRE